MNAHDTVLYRDITEQLSHDVVTAVRQERIIPEYGQNITAATVVDVLNDSNHSKYANDIKDAAFMYDSQFGALA